MSHWNYRVIRKYHKESDSSTYQIHEVYYDDENIIECWTQSPVEPMGESLAELRNDIQYFLLAFQKPVLKEIIKNGKEVLALDEEVSEINIGHYPELLDRSLVATDYLYQFIGNHPVVRKNRELFEIYSRAEEALSLLYQRVGELIE
ncbi:MAG TPA: hypothetical protein PK874_04605 [Desulfobacteraceae bacterium]|nr:hypothetical protein [Desulfobacteraceae bacterium]HPJ67644.1 hypothetical protein [Desulfobacteraceae bacterium]HPQ29424.1 hypothetical protein [Desulfobacteraceae bacterium]